MSQKFKVETVVGTAAVAAITAILGAWWWQRRSASDAISAERRCPAALGPPSEAGAAPSEGYAGVGTPSDDASDLEDSPTTEAEWAERAKLAQSVLQRRGIVDGAISPAAPHGPDDEVRLALVNCRPEGGEYDELYIQLLRESGGARSMDHVKVTVFELAHRGELPCEGDSEEAVGAYDAFLFSGSRCGVYEGKQGGVEWINRLEEFVRGVYIHGGRMIGICFGHQMICHALGGKAELNTARGFEFGMMGFTPSRQAAAYLSALAGSACPERITLPTVHGDWVVPGRGVPPGLAVIGGTETSPVNATWDPVRGQVLTFQGHPEFSVAYMERLLDKMAELGVLPGRMRPRALRRYRARVRRNTAAAAGGSASASASASGGSGSSSAGGGVAADEAPVTLEELRRCLHEVPGSVDFVGLCILRFITGHSPRAVRRAAAAVKADEAAAKARAAAVAHAEERKRRV